MMILHRVRMVLRTFGVRGVVRRTREELRRRFGWYLLEPRRRLTGSGAPPSDLYAPRGLPESLGLALREDMRTRGSRVVAGEFLAFGHEWRAIPASAEAWQTHPFTGYRFPTGPWWRVPHLPEGADIKDVWEPGRFAWVFDLVRAHAASPADSYPRFFHEAVADWFASNPPFRGNQWACGQETAIRALALLHGEAALPLHGGGRPSAPLLAVFAASGERIADAIGYGLSQRNNHGISEAAGLVHLGLRLRGLHPAAARWIRRGRRLLEEQIEDQFSPDGWYAQHSFTYMRTALEQVLLVQHALESTGASLSDSALSRVDASIRLLTLLVDGTSGVVPNHGANDGGRVVHLSCKPYRDFRPLLTLAAAIRNTGLPADIVPDPEVSFWLGAAVLPLPPRPDGEWRGASGWVIVRRAGWTVFVRAGSYEHRPSHLDCLHVDVRYEAAELVTDPGTFRYNAPPPWRNGLAGSTVHNGPVLDGREHAQRGPRFLWYTWPDARVTDVSADRTSTRVIAEIPGRSRRALRIGNESIEIEDVALDPKARELQVTWLLHPDAREYDCVVAEGGERLQAEEGSVDGWFSPTYGLRQPSTALRVRRQGGREEMVARTIIRPPARADGDNLQRSMQPAAGLPDKERPR